MKPFLLFILLSGFTFTVSAQKQGIEGEVFWLSGNQMPGPGKPHNIPQQGLVREIYIYKVAELHNTVQTDGFFTDVKTELVTKIVSHADGSFKVKLPPGEYSLFTKEPKGLFANLFDKDSKINPVIVKPKKYAWITITVDYESAY